MGTSVLLVLSENFDDMAFLSCQVILEENGHDVIISSKDRGIIKGETSSVMVVSLNSALNQGIDYSTLVLLLSDDAEIYAELIDTVKQFKSNSKLIISVSAAIKVLEGANIKLYVESDVTEVDHVIHLRNLDLVEEFFEDVAKKIR